MYTYMHKTCAHLSLLPLEPYGGLGTLGRAGYMYIYICMYVYVCICICICIYTYTCSYIYIST